MSRSLGLSSFVFSKLRRDSFIASNNSDLDTWRIWPFRPNNEMSKLPTRSNSEHPYFGKRFRGGAKNTLRGKKGCAVAPVSFDSGASRRSGYDARIARHLVAHIFKVDSRLEEGGGFSMRVSCNTP